ncbi:MAG: murein biosynthesis integral membrane protein MurJ [Acidimicrobiia bacterium]|nr:murein biosynthesis integral membrane protein MurJ [Acidimicrobiia bacterium]
MRGFYRRPFVGDGVPGAGGFSARRRRSGRSAAVVGGGVVLSRLSGVAREVILGAFLGTRASADAFGAALRIPKLLQNLLGEGALSAAFIPVYAQVLEEGDEERAGRLAGAVAGLLAVLTGGLVLLAIFLAEPLTWLVAPGFSGVRHELTVVLIRIMAGGIGLIVLAAWCLGVLNAHRRFFLSYVAPVLWNVAIIAAVAAAGVAGAVETGIAEAAAWGVLVGGALQFAVQVPAVVSLVPRLRISLQMRLRGVREVARRFGPAVAGRGVVTLSSYVDVILASLLATGAIAYLDRAQVLYLMPISVFAVSVAAADLPELAREQDSRERMHERLVVGAARVLLFLVYALVAFVVLGRPIVGALYQRVNFTADDTYVVWLVLAAYSLGIVAAGLSRLLQNTCYAAGDVKGPARIAAGRLVFAALGGLALMIQLDRVGVIDGEIRRLGGLPAFWLLDSEIRQTGDIRRLGAVGLALAAAVAAWLEFGLLRKRIGRTLGLRPPFGRLLGRLLPGAAVAAVAGVLLVRALEGVPYLVSAPVSLIVTGGLYLLLANLCGQPAARDLLLPLRRHLWRRRRG